MGLTVWSNDHCVEWCDTQHRDMAGCNPLYPAAFRRFLSLIIAKSWQIASPFVGFSALFVVWRSFAAAPLAFFL